MRQRNALYARLAVIAVGIPVAVTLAFAWLQRLTRVSPSYGAVAGALAAAVLGYYMISKAKGQTLASAIVLTLFLFIEGIILFKVIGL